MIKKADIKIKDVQDGRVKYKGEDWSKDVESTAKALDEKKKSLDEKAKKLGYEDEDCLLGCLLSYFIS